MIFSEEDIMIVNFKVNNYKGIEKEAVINAKASNKIKRSDRKYSIISDKYKLLKTICLIGCNGSGKTSILSAVDTLQTFISFPFRKNVKENDNFVNYVKAMSEEELKNYLIKLNTLSLGEQNINRKNEPTTIEIELYIPKRENNISGFYTYKIIYDYNYNKNGVLSESLTYRPNYIKRNVINLCKSKNIIESQIGTAILYENNININKNNTKYIEYYKSFVDELLNYTDCVFDGVSTDIREILKYNKDDFIKLCNIADDKIIDVSIDENSKNRNILFWNSNGNSLYFSQLSEGTRKIIILGSIIIEAIKNNATLLIDEIEQSLHPTLVDFLIDLATSKHLNNYTQLIFTTHSPLLAFSLENDELYFINNHNDSYYFSDITNAIKMKIITKDQSRQKAWVDDLLIKNPDKEKIEQFISIKNKD